jgi:hypothetical protein
MVRTGRFGCLVDPRFGYQRGFSDGFLVINEGMVEVARKVSSGVHPATEWQRGDSTSPAGWFRLDSPTLFN